MTISKHDLERLERLERRCEHLQARIDAALRRDLTYDKAELSALRWAIKTIRELKT